MEQLTSHDREQIRQKGLTEEDIEQQIRNFRKGFPFTSLEKTARIGDGIYQPGQIDLQHFQQVYVQARSGLSVMEFVPA